MEGEKQLDPYREAMRRIREASEQHYPFILAVHRLNEGELHFLQYHEWAKADTKMHTIRALASQIKPPIKHVNKAQYEDIVDLLHKAETLVGNHGTNISSSTDLACEQWHEAFKKLIF